LLAGLQSFLLEPTTVTHLTEVLNARLNALIDERPRLQALKSAERDTVRRKLAHLMRAVEDGAATPGLFVTLRAREEELGRFEHDLDTLEAPLKDRLAVMPAWVRREVADVAALLSEAPERAKREFQRLGVGFTVSPVVESVKSPSSGQSERRISLSFWRGQAPTLLLPLHRTLDQYSEVAGNNLGATEVAPYDGCARRSPQRFRYRNLVSTAPSMYLNGAEPVL
jgi:GNAT superfamily N-acetyltransferase